MTRHRTGSGPPPGKPSPITARRAGYPTRGAARAWRRAARIPQPPAAPNQAHAQDNPEMVLFGGQDRAAGRVLDHHPPLLHLTILITDVYYNDISFFGWLSATIARAVYPPPKKVYLTGDPRQP